MSFEIQKEEHVFLTSLPTLSTEFFVEACKIAEEFSLKRTFAYQASDIVILNNGMRELQGMLACSYPPRHRSRYVYQHIEYQCDISTHP